MGFYLFPFDLVPKASKVIIYGAGNVGQEYGEQIRETDWCEIVCFTDRDYKRYGWMKTAVVCPTAGLFAETGYDFAIIAIEALRTVEKVKQDLRKWGVPDDKIINVSKRYLANARQEVIIYDEKAETRESEVIKIAYQMVGSMGTYIIYLKLLEEIVKLCSDCMVTVFGKVGAAKHFYEKHPNVVSIREYNELNNENECYDIVLQVGHVVRLKRLLYPKAKRLCPELAERLKRLYEEFDNYYCDVAPHHLMDNLFIRKACFLGINRYTALGHNGIFDLEDKKAHVFVDENYAEAFNRLKLKRYITFNRGAASISGEDREQTKLWPKEHFVEFVKEFKRKFADIAVVQIGAGDLERLEGAERYIMGEHLELVKHILKNSLFHLDCEGGLVHIATQLGTKCIVLFGPTSPQYFGYEQNENIASDRCGDCRWIAADWLVHCYRKNEKLICMRSITPAMVLERAEKVLQCKDSPSLSGE
jgi:hypothetical protein